VIIFHSALFTYILTSPPLSSTGSAVFKSLTPSLLSSGIYLLLHFFKDIDSNDEEALIGHPYAIGAFIAALTFLLAFRANFAYNRYWEACTAVHQMHSKWLDVGTEMAAFHLQSARYDDRKPPAFGAHPHIKCLERERERLNEPTLEDLEEQLEGMTDAAQSLRSRMGFLKKNKSKKRTKAAAKPIQKSINAAVTHNTTTTPTITDGIFGFQQLNWILRRRKTVIKIATGKRKNEYDPSPFLLEGAHLLSLLSACAMSTLRNDLEQAESPLTTFKPGQPWPHVDPDDYSADVRKDWTMSTHRTWTVLKYLFGFSRTSATRTLYNAARPFRVVGGVSDAEIAMLQAARGPMAKVALCSLWLQEYITREYLAGSTGKVAAPIISRLYQFTSDGMLGYNQARKIAYIPFPFPHAQITSLFVLVAVGFLPVLFLVYLENVYYGFIMNLMTVMCFAGLHEVARELENPFQNVPNDLPLNNFHAQYNEALMTMFLGYHPDAYWEIHEGEYPPTPAEEPEAEPEEVIGPQETPTEVVDEGSKDE
jgi:predicted membrane chloride channel (bestrophin family)